MLKGLNVIKSVKSVKLSPHCNIKFYCQFCDYKASQKSHYEKHLKTKKHLTKTTKIGGKSVKKERKKEQEILGKKSVSEKILKEEYEINILKEKINTIIENQNIIKKETSSIKKMKSEQNIIYNNEILVKFFRSLHSDKPIYKKMFFCNVFECFSFHLILFIR